MPANTKRGFTLIELLVAISIIAILSLVGLTLFSSAQQQARDGRRRGDLEAIRQALEIYRNVNGFYPKTGGSGGWVTSNSATSPWLKPTAAGDPGLDTYMSKVPTDPLNDGGSPWLTTGGHSYGYYTDSTYGGADGSWFILIAKLELPNNDDLASKCRMPDGSCIGSTNAGCAADHTYAGDLIMCYQQ